MRQKLFVGVILIAALLLAGCTLWQKPQPKPSEGKSQADITLEGVPVGNKTAEEIRRVAVQIAETQKQDPVNAAFRPDAAGFIPEKNGLTVDVEETVKKVLAAPANSAVQTVVQVKKPMITAEKLQAAQLVAQAETPLLDKGENRIHNIRVAAHNLTNTIIMPGEVFSFNKTIGNTTVERGYRIAPIIEEGRTISGLGGGVCQISSTMYSAVVAANFPVVERYPHSKPVDYVPEGMDATTSDDKDFKFRSNRRRPLIIHVLVTADAVRTDLWEIGAGD